MYGNHSPFGWDLPPGVTQQHIDDAFGDDDEGGGPDDDPRDRTEGWDD